jgi:hypothetical protein
VSAAFVAVTEQLPLPLLTVTVAPATEHEPVAVNVTAPTPLPPEVPTVNMVPYGCDDPGIPVTVSVAWLAKVAVVVAAAEVALL